jgi:hypothetical protein
VPSPSLQEVVAVARLRVLYTAWAVGFLSPTDDYPGFGVFVSTDG